MRKDFGAKPYIYPQPVLIIASYDENNIPDAMNAAWGGISEQDEITICLDDHHKTTKNILLKKAFTVSIGEASQVVACDYLGVESGNRVNDKIEKAGFHVSKAKHIDAPMIDELALCLECRLKSYDENTCQLIAQIVNKFFYLLRHISVGKPPPFRYAVRNFIKHRYKFGKFFYFIDRVFRAADKILKHFILNIKLRFFLIAEG